MTDLVLWSDEEIQSRLREIEDESAKLTQELERRKRGQKVAECGLSLREISRYSRQLLLPEMSVKGQRLLKKTRGVLIVGAGGLGCPSAMYLAAAGVGRIGVVDHDTVDLSNLHRQILHTERGIGMPKAESIKKTLRMLNSDVNVVNYDGYPLSSANALDLLSGYDVVLDASDNVATRYLLNDACVKLGKPLISGSALRFEGQLTVYNYPVGIGPTYRCLFPSPPPPAAVTNCSDGGILGAVTGVIGSLQAVEAIKILTGSGDVLSGSMVIYDALAARFRHVKLRGRQVGAEVDQLIDYEQFCGALATDKDEPLRLIQPEERLSVLEYKRDISDKPHLLIDVRTEPEMEICRLDNAVNIPVTEFTRSDRGLDKIHHLIKEKHVPIVIFCCRRGNDSQVVLSSIKDKFKGVGVICRDLVGGLHAWNKKIDPDFPVY